MPTVEKSTVVAKIRPVAPGSIANKSQSASTSHLPALDGLRGLAIALVLITHCENALHWTPQSDFFVKAVHKVVCFSTCGVDLFFVLSGFLITGILLRSKNSANYFKSFYVRRALRIFPLYYLALALIWCGIKIWGEPPDALMGMPADRTWLWFYGTNILMTLRHTWTYSSLNHFWSLAVEEHFYLVWPFLVMALETGPLLWFCLAAVPASLLIRAAFVYPLHNELAAYVLTICRVDSLLIGCFIAIVAYLRGPEILKRSAVAVALGMAVLVPIFIGVVPHASNTDRIWGPTIFALLFASLLVLTLTRTECKHFFENRVLRVLGKYSYGLYIYHFIVIVGLEHLWSWNALPPVPNYLLFLFVASACSMLIAVTSYQLYEVHFLKLKKYFQA
ncbi:MAG: acyltransferase [Candidatus Melainabacteria bacterium]|nr:MAG: acyltransferase [Candidatus Melainabacteria bacterium]